MKCVVVEIKDKNVAILSDNGTVEIIKNKNYSLGEVIIMKKNNTKKLSKKLIVSIASVAAVLCFGCLGAYAYYTPAGYVSLDINPSIEYTLNTFDRVIDVTGVNEDGEAIVSEIDVDGMKIEDAIDQTVDQLIDTGYIGDEASEIVISANCENDGESDELAQKLQTSTQKKLDGEGKIGNVEAYAVGKERVEEAEELGVSPGKLNLVEKLKESAENPDDIDISEWLDKPVKEIQSVIKDNKDKAQNDNANKDEKENGSANNEKNENGNTNTEQNKEENKEQNTDSILTQNQEKNAENNQENNSEEADEDEEDIAQGEKNGTVEQQGDTQQSGAQQLGDAQQAGAQQQGSTGKKPN